MRRAIRQQGGNSRCGRRPRVPLALGRPLQEGEPASQARWSPRAGPPHGAPPPRFQVLAIGLRLWLGERLRTRKRAFPRRLLVKPYAHTCCCSLPGLQVHGIIFVLDASDEARFAEAKHELAVVADSPAALGKPILMSASPRPLCTRHRAPFAPGRCGAGRAGCAWWFCRGPWTRPTCVPLPHALLLASLVPILRAAEC